MSAPAFAITPMLFPSFAGASFIAADTTIAKILFEPATADAGAATPRYGGATLLDLTATSTDAVAKDVLLWLGEIRTTQETTATGDVTLTAQNKLSRAAGSWIANGWKPGMSVMTFTPPGTAQIAAAIDGIAGIVTAVTALDLTVNGTPFAAGTNLLTAGTRFVQTAQLFRATVAANAGNTAAIPNVSLLGNLMDSSLIRTEFKLGSSCMLIAGMQTAVSALPAQVFVVPRGVALY